MSKLNVDQKTIKDLFQDKKSDFLIPDYQRLSLLQGEADVLQHAGRAEVFFNVMYFQNRHISTPLTEIIQLLLQLPKQNRQDTVEYKIIDRSEEQRPCPRRSRRSG